ncbi:YegP family protein [Nocardia salmonicida]|uniref:YegP family protein n=1 Tax=Nocardia salmonicida TaxID=53431 RepID=UPI0033CFA2E4
MWGARFRALATQGRNGEIISQSQASETEAAAQKGINSVQTNATGATVVDLTPAAE